MNRLDPARESAIEQWLASAIGASAYVDWEDLAREGIALGLWARSWPVRHLAVVIERRWKKIKWFYVRRQRTPGDGQTLDEFLSALRARQLTEIRWLRESIRQMQTQLDQVKKNSKGCTQTESQPYETSTEPVVNHRMDSIVFASLRSASAVS